MLEDFQARVNATMQMLQTRFNQNANNVRTQFNSKISKNQNVNVEQIARNIINRFRNQ
jgi:hypothetical protein